MNEHELLGEAASHACWRALAILLEDLRAKAPSWISLYNENIEDAVDLTTNSALARATMAHCGTHYRFGADAVKAAATRGHLTAVQWLMPRWAEASGHVEPSRIEKVDKGRYRHFIPIDEFLKAAAGNQHLHVVQWIVDAEPHLHCVVPYDEELQAVGWISRDYYHCSVTAKHGFSYVTANHPDVTSSASASRIKGMHVPLANGFARDGDLDTLKKIVARPNSSQLIGPSAIALAAEHGHLDIVEWLFELFPHSLSTTCFGSAASGGHVEVLKWLQQQMPLETATIVLDAVYKGHVHVLRWLRSTDPNASIHFNSSALANAIQRGHLEVVKFLHKIAFEQGDITHDHLV